MGKRGTKRKPAIIRRLTGNPSKRPIQREFVPVGNVPPCPDWLGKVGRKYWDNVLSVLPSGVVTAADADLLAQYAYAWEEFHQAREEIAESGFTITTSRGLEMTAPAVTRKDRACDRIRRLAALFGLSPADRAGIAPVQQEDQDPFTAMLSKRA